MGLPSVDVVDGFRLPVTSAIRSYAIAGDAQNAEANDPGEAGGNRRGPRKERAIVSLRQGPRFRVPGLPVDRNGALCPVIVRGAMNSALIEFEDGEKAVVSRNALCRAVTVCVQV